MLYPLSYGGSRGASVKVNGLRVGRNKLRHLWTGYAIWSVGLVLIQHCTIGLDHTAIPAC